MHHLLALLLYSQLAHDKGGVAFKPLGFVSSVAITQASRLLAKNSCRTVSIPTQAGCHVTVRVMFRDRSEYVYTESIWCVSKSRMDNRPNRLADSLKNRPQHPNPNFA